MQSNFNPSQPLNQQDFLPNHSLHQGTDPNSPALFKQNIQIAQDHVAQLQNLARSALAGIQNAYHPGNSPAQTEANLAALKQSLDATIDILWRTGVGALPLLPSGGPDVPMAVPSEDQMGFEANRAIQILHEKLKRSQDSASVVASLLGTSDQTLRNGR